MRRRPKGVDTDKPAGATKRILRRWERRQSNMPHDHNAIEERLEQSADAVAEQYAADVQERGGLVGPFYGWSQGSTAYTPPRTGKS
jgi:hypothetical protein